MKFLISAWIENGEHSKMGEGSEAHFQKNIIFSSFPFDEFSIYSKFLLQIPAKSSLLVGRPSSAVP